MQKYGFRPKGQVPMPSANFRTGAREFIQTLEYYVFKLVHSSYFR